MTTYSTKTWCLTNPLPPRHPPEQDKPPRITHDACIKRLLAEGRRALAFMRLFLPRKIAVRLADKLPVLLDTQHVSPTLKTRRSACAERSRSDLIFKVFLEGGGFFHVVVEHKSKRDARVLKQSYDYYTSLLNRICEEVVQALDGDPAIVNLLVYNGLEFWNPKVTLKGKTAEQAKQELDELTLEDFAPGFRSLFIDLKAYEIADLPDDPELRSGLAVMVYDSVEVVEQIADGLVDGSDHQTSVLTYIGQYWDTDLSLVEKTLDDIGLRKGGQKMGEIARKLLVHLSWVSCWVLAHSPKALLPDGPDALLGISS